MNEFKQLLASKSSLIKQRLMKLKDHQDALQQELRQA